MSKYIDITLEQARVLDSLGYEFYWRNLSFTEQEKWYTWSTSMTASQHHIRTTNTKMEHLVFRCVTKNVPTLIRVICAL